MCDITDKELAQIDAAIERQHCLSREIVGLVERETDVEEYSPFDVMMVLMDAVFDLAAGAPDPVEFLEEFQEHFQEFKPVVIKNLAKTKEKIERKSRGLYSLSA